MATVKQKKEPGVKARYNAFWEKFKYPYDMYISNLKKPNSGDRWFEVEARTKPDQDSVKEYLDKHKDKHKLRYKTTLVGKMVRFQVWIKE